MGKEETKEEEEEEDDDLLQVSQPQQAIKWTGFSAKEKKRMNEIPNIEIPAPGGQRVATPSDQFLGVSNHAPLMLSAR